MSNEAVSTSAPASGPTPPPNKPSPPPPKRTKLTKTLPTDRIPFPKQPEILRGFAAAYEKNNGPVSNDDAGKFVGLSGATIQQINAFFVDVGVLQRSESGKFTPSTAAIDYFKAHQFNPDRAWAKLASDFERSWFGQELVAKLKFRAMDESEALADLALASNADQGYEGQLKVGIEWLVQVGLATREGSQLKLGRQSPGTTPEQQQPAVVKPKEVTPESEEADLHRSEIALDPKSKRRLVIWAPPTITTKELERIKSWLAVQLIVTDDKASS